MKKATLSCTWFLRVTRAPAPGHASSLGGLVKSERAAQPLGPYKKSMPTQNGLYEISPYPVAKPVHRASWFTGTRPNWFTPFVYCSPIGGGFCL